MSLSNMAYNFNQTEDATELGVAIQKYGAVIIPVSATGEDITLEVQIGDTVYTASSAITDASDVGDTVTLVPADDSDDSDADDSEFG